MFKLLRDKILELAITGKLVPQLDSEPAVEQIGPAPKPEEVPFVIPEKWKWVRLSSVTDAVRGGSPRPISDYITDDPNGLNWIRIGDATNGSRIISACQEKIKPEGLSKTRLIPKGSLILSNSMSFGLPYILGIDGCIHDGWLAFSNFELNLDIEFFYFLLCSSCCQQQFAQKAAGTTVKNLNLDRVKATLLPIPPLAEQQRIVATLKPLLEELDTMERDYTELSGPMYAHFKDLILQKAISGKLVPQLDGEPAVEQIGATPAPNEVPFAIPEKWKWVKAGQLGFWKAGGTPSRSNPAFWNEGTINWIKTGELNDGIINCVEEKISQEGFNNSSTHLNPVGAVLIAMYGATIGRLGVLAVPSTTNQACCACTVNKDLVDNWFLFFVLMGLRPLLIKQGAGSAQPNISKDKLVNQWVPLPPLEEQRRIVARIEELFGDVDKLLEWQQFA